MENKCYDINLAYKMNMMFLGMYDVLVWAKSKKWIKRLLQIVTIVALTLLAIRVYDSQKGVPLELWHTVHLNELASKQIENANWDDYLLAEQTLFDELKQKVTDQLTKDKRQLLNRYAINSPTNPDNFKTNWNRSFILKPDHKPLGAVVLLHGLTDSPYSLRHIALYYQKKGFVVVAIRMPAHGTTPSALVSVKWEDWLAATYLAVRTASSYIEKEQPLHIVGYSNGGALALMYTLDSIDNSALAKPDQVILISPMIGVTSFARFAGLAGLPAIFPPFAKAAWVNIIPEYNPFKYNSFPINGARQSYELTVALQKKVVSLEKQKLTKLPPILTFLSVVDSTVNTRSAIEFYNLLPNHHHELVVFDVNRNVKLGPLLKDKAYYAIEDLLPKLPRNYETIVVTNRSLDSKEAVAYITKAQQIKATEESLNTTYPSDLYSLSHIALPFPVTDSLYGEKPMLLNEFGISIGALAIRGEREVLVTSLDNLLRASYNPFYSFLIQQIDQRVEATLNKKIQ